MNVVQEACKLQTNSVPKISKSFIGYWLQNTLPDSPKCYILAVRQGKRYPCA
jgi:hypothetical protein